MAVAERRAGGLARLLLLAAALCPPGMAAADTERSPQQWLERMAEALTSLNFDGVFVYQHDEALESMRIVHESGERGQYERLVALSGRHREVIRDDTQVTCILPDETSFVLDRRPPGRSFPPTMPEEGEGLREHYRLSLGDSGRVAGRLVREVRMDPRDTYRYGYRFWADEETGMLLRSEMLDAEQRPVEQFMFTHIEFLDRVPESLLEPGLDGEEFHWYHHREAEHGPEDEQGHWRAGRLPDGFEMDLFRRHYAGEEDGGTPVEHMVFSDGLASVSVFVEPADRVQSPLEGRSRRGAVNAYGRVAGEHQITVVGEVPADTVRLIAEGVGPRTGGGEP